MDTYFRQTWDDERLKFNRSQQEMAVHIKMLQKIWKPDTYFLNGMGSYLHMITEPNKLLRIMRNGTILYSMRLFKELSHYYNDFNSRLVKTLSQLFIETVGLTQSKLNMKTTAKITVDNYIGLIRIIYLLLSHLQSLNNKNRRLRNIVAQRTLL